MANAHRNECAIKIGKKTFTVRATLELLEEYEDRFAEAKLRPSTYYRIIGFLLSKSDKEITEEEAADLAFNEGLIPCQEAFQSFLTIAYNTGGDEEEGGKPQTEADPVTE